MKMNPSAGMGGALTLSGDAENWLKTNLNINVQEMVNNPTDHRFSQRV